MANKKWYVVTAEKGLNLREMPTKRSKVLKVLRLDERIEADNSVEAPEGWIAVKNGGYVMRNFLK